MMYYAFGDAIVTPEEFAEKKLSGELQQFYEKLAKQEKPTSVDFSTGELNTGNVLTPEIFRHYSAQVVSGVVPFSKIGYGMPLTIMIRAVYTGEHPGWKFPWQKTGMLFSSAVKDIASFNAQPQAINYLINDVSDHSYYNRPDASSQGTPYVYYSPAVTEESLTFDISMVFDKFPQPVFDAVGNAMQTAEKIPIFLPYSTYLLTMGSVIKIVGNVGEKLLDGRAQFSATQGLDISLPGAYPTPSGFIFIFGKDIDKKEPNWRKKYHIGISSINNSIVVLDESNEEYRGNVPYVILSFDGAERNKLKSFTPTAASAAILSRFYGMKDGENQPDMLKTLVESCKLLNDVKLRKQIDSINKENDSLPNNDNKKKKNLEQIKALKANIQTEEMKY